MINVKSIKKDFPIFNHQPSLVYLDSTASSLKPQSVIDKLREYYEQYSSNIFRGVYPISERATEEYEETRSIVADFVGAKTEEIVFTRNTTESLNLIAYSLGRQIIGKGDEIVTTVMEHHSNFVPWQVLADEIGAIFKVIDVDEEGYLALDEFKVPASPAGRQSSKFKAKVKNLKLEEIITKKTKILALTYVSNVLGTINPIKEIISIAKKINPKIIVVVDAAQAVPHINLNVQDLGCDFLAFSSHKMLGPTGVGALWGRRELLETIYPFNYGGEMIQEVYLDRTVFKPPPHKFEAGTPAIAEVIAFKGAVKYLDKIGLDNIKNHEHDLLVYCFKSLNTEFGKRIKILGPADLSNRTGIISFVFDKVHPHDIGSLLAEDNICIRVGNHCAMPLHQRLGVNASSRISFYLYNTKEDVNKLVASLKKAISILS